MVICFLFTGQSYPELEVVRKLYQECPRHEKSCQELLDLLKPYRITDHPLLYGYQASATMMLARHVFSPVSKLRNFNRGKQMLEAAISAAPEDVELRLLRLLAQSNAPGFLGYRDEIVSDKNFIFNELPKIREPQTRDFIIRSLAALEHIEPARLQSLKKQ